MISNQLWYRAREQILEAEGHLPNALVACIGGGSNAIGLSTRSLMIHDVAIYGVEAAGKGLGSGLHAASLTGGTPGILHGNRTYLLQNMMAKSPTPIRFQLAWIIRVLA